ncbi:MAG TPA: peptide-methionine (S)-S-oxide reductase MsrA, partial [Gemmatimonadales bacterium]|nr:peptide-methionine (S)-S-oxide reductase MsrA [Gemmatimonadales bacterium]
MTGRAGFAGLVTVLMAVSASALGAQRSAQDAQRTAPGAPQPAPATAVAVFSGGCFWGVQAVFEHVKGVIRAESGYTGGKADDADYATVSTGRTGHAESVRVVYDPARISYDQLLQVFFTVAHDPTQLYRQGPVVGTQYRSAVFYRSPSQREAA